MQDGRIIGNRIDGGSIHVNGYLNSAAFGSPSNVVVALNELSNGGAPAILIAAGNVSKTGTPNSQITSGNRIEGNRVQVCTKEAIVLADAKNCIVVDNSMEDWGSGYAAIHMNSVGSVTTDGNVVANNVFSQSNTSTGSASYQEGAQVQDGLFVGNLNTVSGAAISVNPLTNVTGGGSQTRVVRNQGWTTGIFPGFLPRLSLRQELS